jgi:hypothetical protein
MGDTRVAGAGAREGRHAISVAARRTIFRLIRGKPSDTEKAETIERAGLTALLVSRINV